MKSQIILESKVEEIGKLGKLRDQNIISNEEFEVEKAKLLGKNEVVIKSTKQKSPLSINSKRFLHIVIAFLLFPLIFAIPPIPLGGGAIYLVIKKMDKNDKRRKRIIVLLCFVTIILSILWLNLVPK